MDNSSNEKLLLEKDKKNFVKKMMNLAIKVEKSSK